MKSNFLIYAPKILASLVWEIIYFPLWWYGQGFVKLLINQKTFLAGQFTKAGIWVWLKNLFVPMYGQRDFISRLISFLVRLVQIIGRSLIFLFWSLLSLGVIIIWLGLPIGLILAIILQIVN